MPVVAVSHRAQVVVVADAGEHDLGRLRRLARAAGHRPAMLLAPGFRLGRRAVPHRHLVALGPRCPAIGKPITPSPTKATSHPRPPCLAPGRKLRRPCGSARHRHASRPRRSPPASSYKLHDAVPRSEDEQGHHQRPGPPEGLPAARLHHPGRPPPVRARPRGHRRHLHASGSSATPRPSAGPAELVLFGEDQELLDLRLDGTPAPGRTAIVWSPTGSSSRACPTPSSSPSARSTAPPPTSG